MKSRSPRSSETQEDRLRKRQQRRALLLLQAEEEQEEAETYVRREFGVHIKGAKR